MIWPISDEYSNFAGACAGHVTRLYEMKIPSKKKSVTWLAQAPAKFEYSSLIGQGSNHRSLMLVTSHVRSALCTLTATLSFCFSLNHLTKTFPVKVLRLTFWKCSLLPVPESLHPRIWRAKNDAIVHLKKIPTKTSVQVVLMTLAMQKCTMHKHKCR